MRLPAHYFFEVCGFSVYPFITCRLYFAALVYGFAPIAPERKELILVVVLFI